VAIEVIYIPSLDKKHPIRFSYAALKRIVASDAFRNMAKAGFDVLSGNINISMCLSEGAFETILFYGMKYGAQKEGLSFEYDDPGELEDHMDGVDFTHLFEVFQKQIETAFGGSDGKKPASKKK